MKKRNSKAPTLTDLYNKELRRIKRFIREAGKRGYEWKESPIPDRPKRIRRESVEALKKKRPEYFYKKARYVNKETGEILTGLQGRQLERKAVAQKAAETKQRAKEDFFAKTVIQQYRTELNKWRPEFQDKMNAWLDRVIESVRPNEDDLGMSAERAVSQMLEQGRQNGLIITYIEAYDNEACSYYMTQMLNYLPEIGQRFVDEMTEYIYEESGWNSPK